MFIADQQIHDRKPPQRPGRVFQIVNPHDIAEEVVVAFGIVAQVTHDRVQTLSGNNERGLAAKLRRFELDVRKGGLDQSQRWMIEIRFGHVQPTSRF